MQTRTGCEIFSSQRCTEEISGFFDAKSQLFGAIFYTIKMMNLPRQARGRDREGTRSMKRGPFSRSTNLFVEMLNAKPSGGYWYLLRSIHMQCF